MAGMPAHIAAQLLYEFENTLSVALNPKDRDHHARDAYPFIPYNTSSFYALMEVAIAALPFRGRRPSFLDVGCGPGTKLHVARAMGCHADGLEIDPDLAALARKCYSDFRALIIEADAFLFNDYGSYDIIYAYSPPIKPKSFRRLMGRIVRLAKPGAVLIFAYHKWEPGKRAGLETISSNIIFRKKGWR